MAADENKPHIDMKAMMKFTKQQSMNILVRAGFKMQRDIKLSMGKTAGGEKRQGQNLKRSKSGKFLRDKRSSKPGDPPFVQTGRLRASISVNWNDPKVKRVQRGKVGNKAFVSDAIPPPDKGDVVRVGTNVEYAAGLEFGTSKMAKRPYIGPALNRLTIP